MPETPERTGKAPAEINTGIDARKANNKPGEKKMLLKSEVVLQGELNTIAELFIDGVFYGYVLEDPMREVKIPKITGIPCGFYDVKLSWSGKYSAKYGNINIPEIMVPNYVGIRIHPGNYETDTDGCQLVGKSYTALSSGKGWKVHETKVLSENLNLKIIAAINDGYKVTFEKVVK